MDNGDFVLLIMFGGVVLIVCTMIICGTITSSRKCKHDYDNGEPIIVEHIVGFGGDIIEKCYRIVQTCKKCGHINTVKISKWD